jgi:flagellar motor protein MotB
LQPLRIIGHADSKTRADDPMAATQINLTMSLKRATAVLKELNEQGVPYSQMSVFAYGNSQPLWDVEGKTKAQAARRVEIYVDKK